MPDAALDATADALARQALAALPAAQPRSRDDTARLPPPVARLLDARLDAAVDGAAPSHSPWLDDERVREAAAAWHEAAYEAVHFPADAWPGAVRQAAGLALAHLIRPAETLAATAFEGEAGPVAVDAVLARIRAFGPYPYLPEIVARYVERKGLDWIDRAGLERLLQRIDRRMVSAFGPDDWMTLLGPLFELAGPVGHPPGAVPAALLRPLFYARGADALAASLAEIDAVTPDDLRARLTEVLSPATASGPPSPEPEPAGEAGASGPAASTPEPDADGAEPPAHPIATGPPDLSPPSMPPLAEGVRPPVIGSKFAAPEYEENDDSEVLGPPRPAGAYRPEPDAPEAPMDAIDEVREDVAEAAPEPPDDAPPVPTLDLPASGPTSPPVASPPPRPPGSVRFSPIPDPRSPDEEPLWKRIARDRGEDPAPVAESAGPDEPDEEPLWKRFAQSDLAARLPDPPAPADLGDDVGASPSLDAIEARVLGPGARDRRDWFVAELFGGSPGAYHRTLDQIGRASSYTDATAVVSSEVFRKHSVDPYTDSAVAFTDALQDQFERRA